jgi:hypothetical protein
MGVIARGRQVLASRANAAEGFAWRVLEIRKLPPGAGCGGLNLAGAVVLLQFFYEKFVFSGRVFLLFAGDFNALACLDTGGISDEAVSPLVALVLEGEAIGAGGGASTDRWGLANKKVDADAQSSSKSDGRD